MKTMKQWTVNNKEGEISVSYGPKEGVGWADVDKFVMPETNPGTEGQNAYMLKVAHLFAAVLNVNEVVPYCDKEPE